MIRTFASALPRVILGQKPATLRTIMEARPFRIASIHRQERDATSCIDASSKESIVAKTLHDALPPTERLSVLVLVARAQEGLVTTPRQAQAHRDALQTPMPIGQIGLTSVLVVQIGNEPLRRPKFRQLNGAAKLDAALTLSIKHVGTQRVVALLVPATAGSLLATLAISKRMASKAG